MSDELKEDTTKTSVKALPKMNEQEYAQYRYDQALQYMLDHPTNPEARIAFERANKKLYEVQDAYRIGARLLLERARRVQRAFRSILPR